MARLDRPTQDGVEPGWYRVKSESGAAGNVYLPGLLPGRYAVLIAHPEFGRQAVTLDVPRQSTSEAPTSRRAGS